MNNHSFSYTYSAQEDQQIRAIRKKYLPKEESKLEQLYRLDEKVQNAGMTQSLCVGVISALIFGLGMSLALEALGNVMWLGIPVGIVGMIGMLMAYPVYCKRQKAAKDVYGPQILALSEELMQGKNE